MMIQEKKAKDYLSPDNTKRIKGIFAIFIVLHHLNQWSSIIQNQYVGLIFQSMGYLSVAMFFFLSGYGIAASYKKSGGAYIRSFPKKHILPFYVSCIILIAIYVGFGTLVIGNPFDVKLFVLSFLWGGTVISNGWYLQAILVIYLAIYVIFKYVNKDSLKILVLALFLLAYVFFCILMNAGTTRYESIYAVLLGVVWSFYQPQIEEVLHRRYVLWLLLAFVSFCLLFAAPMLPLPSFIKVITKMISAPVFVVFVLLILMILPLKFKVFDVLGKYFFEIYVVQGISFELLRSRVIYIQNKYLYAILCVALTALISIIIHPLFKAVNYYLKGKKKNDA